MFHVAETFNFQLSTFNFQLSTFNQSVSRRAVQVEAQAGTSVRPSVELNIGLEDISQGLTRYDLSWRTTLNQSTFFQERHLLAECIRQRQIVQNHQNSRPLFSMKCLQHPEHGNLMVNV